MVHRFYLPYTIICWMGNFYVFSFYFLNFIFFLSDTEEYLLWYGKNESQNIHFKDANKKHIITGFCILNVRIPSFLPE